MSVLFVLHLYLVKIYALFEKRNKIYYSNMQSFLKLRFPSSKLY